MARLFPVLLALIGLLVGLGAGVFLRPADETAETLDEHAEPAEEPDEHEEGTGNEYVKLNNQFVVPVVSGGQLSSLVILSVGLEVKAGTTDRVYSREPKLRDAFLQVLFDHANSGGFGGNLTESGKVGVLRTALRETARRIAGQDVVEVLISDLMRQDS